MSMQRLATDWAVLGPSLARAKRFFSSPKRPDWLWGPSASFNDHRGSFTELKCPGRVINGYEQ